MDVAVQRLRLGSGPQKPRDLGVRCNTVSHENVGEEVPRVPNNTGRALTDLPGARAPSVPPGARAPSDAPGASAPSLPPGARASTPPPPGWMALPTSSAVPRKTFSKLVAIVSARLFANPSSSV